ncbi:MAG: (2Fe-2S) ferredoxin domain-containing protein [Bdellovibrionota bacterium]
MSDDLQLDAHLFICTNKKEKGECCALKGSEALRDELKKRSKDPSRGWAGKVRVNASGCLGHCKEGITAVLYPEGKWFTHLTVDSADELERSVVAALENTNKEDN